LWGLVLLCLAACAPAVLTAQPSNPPPTVRPSPPSSSTPTPSPTPAVTPTPTLSYSDTMPRSWGRYTSYKWKHDGYPYESEHFIVFSDHESQATKERFALEAEKALGHILSVSNIPQKGAVPLNTPKMEVFISSRRNGKVGWQGYAHYGGFLIVFDGQAYRYQMTKFPDQFPHTYLVRHELTHTIVLRILGNRQEPSLPIPDWLHEGLATYMGVPPLPIRSQNLYEIALRDKAKNFGFYYYTLNELMVHYLVETTSMENVIGILFDMKGETLTFEESFELHTGMTPADFLENFDLLVQEFFAAQ